ncbi:MAG: sensor histidine kinase [Myxococcota bacterium]
MRFFSSRLLPPSGPRTFLVALLFWNPLLAGVITLAFGWTDQFLRTWFISFVIAEVVAVECFVAANMIRWLELALYRVRNRKAPVHGPGWYSLLAGIVLPFALPVGFLAGGATARWLGFAWGPPDFGSYRIGLGFGFLIMLLFTFQRTRIEAREMARAAEARIKSLEAARLQAQLAALTAEMNPHLLFNALNTVASLIHRDPDRAEDVVLQLADLYRGVLRASGEATHALAEELALCEAYLKIEQARFEERLRVDIDVAADLDPRAIQVPVLILQPFVENAVKHGISPRARGGHVGVGVHRTGQLLEICIQDDGVGFGQSTQQGAGRAMANCKDRLRLTYGDRAGLEIDDAAGGGTRVVVTIPPSPGEEKQAR